MTDRQVLLSTLNTALSQIALLLPEEQDSALMVSLQTSQAAITDSIHNLTIAITASE